MGVNFKVNDEDMAFNKFYVDHSNNGKVTVARIKVKGATFNSTFPELMGPSTEKSKDLGTTYCPPVICYMILRQGDKIADIQLEYDTSSLEIYYTLYPLVIKKAVKDRLTQADARKIAKYIPRDIENIYLQATRLHELQHARDLDKYESMTLGFMLDKVYKDEMIKEIRKVRKNMNVGFESNIDAIEKEFKNYIDLYYQCRVAFEVRAMREEIIGTKGTKDPRWIEFKRAFQDAPIADGVPVPSYKKVKYKEAWKKYAYNYTDAEFEKLLKDTQKISLGKIAYYYLKALQDKYVAELKNEQISTFGENEQNCPEPPSFEDVLSTGMSIWEGIKRIRGSKAQQSTPRYCSCGLNYGHLSNCAKKQ